MHSCTVDIAGIQGGLPVGNTGIVYLSPLHTRILSRAKGFTIVDDVLPKTRRKPHPRYQPLCWLLVLKRVY
jgi:hypothetical protein